MRRSDRRFTQKDVNMKVVSMNKPSSNPMVVGSSSPMTKFTHRLNSLLEVISKYRVLLVGDGIIDEYHFVTPLGKSPKENIIATRFVEKEIFAGGVWAAGKHVEGFCKTVEIATAPRFTVKKRFVERERVRKIFEVHEENSSKARVDTPNYYDYDLVIVTDFGHGCVTKQMIADMSLSAQFLAVNAQTNSANHGFNLITKYNRADYVVLDELEARLALHDRDSPIKEVITHIGFNKIAITLGPYGSIGYDGDMIYHQPGLDNPVVDTMGAGDAFFCVTAPFAAAGASMPELLAIGNAAGAIKCSVVGHRKSVSKQDLLDVLKTTGTLR